MSKADREVEDKINELVETVNKIIEVVDNFKSAFDGSGTHIEKLRDLHLWKSDFETKDLHRA